MYTKIDSEFWRDEKTRELSRDASLAFLYLITNSHRNMAGLYFLPFQYAAFDLRMTVEEVEKSIKELTSAGLINYDYNKSYILIKNFLKYNQIENANQGKGLLKALKQIPDTVLMIEFAKILSEISSETLSEPLLYLQNKSKLLSETLSEPFRNPSETVSKQEKEKEYIKEEEKEKTSTVHQDGLCMFSGNSSEIVKNEELLKTNTEETKKEEIPLTEKEEDGNNYIPPKKRKTSNPKNGKLLSPEILEEFEELWTIYPRKEGRPLSEKHWLTLRKTYTVRQFKQFIYNYLETIKNETFDRAYLMGSTFFGGRYTDYFDGPVKPAQVEKKKASSVDYYKDVYGNLFDDGQIENEEGMVINSTCREVE